jgi:hypothetical protein
VKDGDFLKANKVNLFVSSVLFVFWYHSPNFLDTPHTTVECHQLFVMLVYVVKLETEKISCNLADSIKGCQLSVVLL